jgi:hypothetical protein
VTVRSSKTKQHVRVPVLLDQSAAIAFDSGVREIQSTIVAARSEAIEVAPFAFVVSLMAGCPGRLPIEDAAIVKRDVVSRERLNRLPLLPPALCQLGVVLVLHLVEIRRETRKCLERLGRPIRTLRMRAGTPAAFFQVSAWLQWFEPIDLRHNVSTGLSLENRAALGGFSCPGGYRVVAGNAAPVGSIRGVVDRACQRAFELDLCLTIGVGLDRDARWIVAARGVLRSRARNSFRSACRAGD